jgi:hypothetical protein
LIKIEVLQSLTSDVTSEEMQKCKYLKKNTVLVDNKHVVQFHEKWSFITCTCLCGRNSFRKCPRYCWHVRASIAYLLDAYYSLTGELNMIIDIRLKDEEELKKQTESVNPKKKWNLFRLFHKN